MTLRLVEEGSEVPKPSMLTRMSAEKIGNEEDDFVAGAGEDSHRRNFTPALASIGAKTKSGKQFAIFSRSKSGKHVVGTNDADEAEGGVSPVDGTGVMMTGTL